MVTPGEQIELFGTLVRDRAGFALRVERGVMFHLHLHRVPVDFIEKSVWVTGTLIGPELIEVEGLRSP